jgi:hypothetical protein
MATHDKELKIRKARARNSPARAITVSAGDTHVVGIGNLRVAIETDGKSWTAQGLEIDYIAQGADMEDAKKQFEDGLACVIHQHMRIYGNIDNLLSPAPREVWKEVLNPKAIRARYSQISVHEIIKQAFGFEKVDYLVLANVA